LAAPATRVEQFHTKFTNKPVWAGQDARRSPSALTMHAIRRRSRPVVLLLLLAFMAMQLLATTSAVAHGFSSVVYVDMTSPEKGHVAVTMGLEYDLLVVSAADVEHDDALFRAGTPAFNDHDPAKEAAALRDHMPAVMAYINAHQRLAVKDGTACVAAPSPKGGVRIEPRDGTDYASLTVDYKCPESGGAHTLTSKLFPDSEGYVKNTKTIVTYEELDLRSGSASLDAGHPSFSTHQSLLTQYGEFWRLGANHLLTGIDHILFLLALIAGSRRLREIVLAASTFTLAHSVTFILAALGVVSVPSSLVEPTIALSIAAVAALHLRRIWELRGDIDEVEDVGRGPLGLDRSGWLRLGVVFCFGLVHGLGFASALGIDQAFSWTLLSSLLVFNLGIESVQLGIILVAFPVLAALRRYRPVWGVSATGTIAAGVFAVGLFWFFQRAAIF
jgi:hypothetical protein